MTIGRTVVLLALCLTVGSGTATAESAHALNERAVVLGSAGRYAEAAQLLEQAHAQDPANEVIARNLGVMRLQEGVRLANLESFETADEWMSKAMPLLADSPEEEKARQTYASVLASLGHRQMEHADPGAAEKTLLRAIELDAGVGAAYWYLGNLYYQASDYEKALHYLEWAAGLVPEHEATIVDLIAKAETEMEVEAGFESKSYGNFTVSFEGSEQREMANEALRLLRIAQRDVARALGYSAPQPIEVKIYTAAQFTEVTLMPDWVPGAFDGKIRLRAGDLRSSDDERLRRLIVHEYAHAVVYRISRNRAPVWLHEGLAQCLEESPNSAGIRLVQLPMDTKERIRSRLALGAEVWLAALDAELLRRQDPQATAEAYQEAKSFVAYLIHRHGGYRPLRNLMTQLSDGSSLHQAMATVYRQGPDALLADWIQSLKDREYRLTAP